MGPFTIGQISEPSAFSVQLRQPTRQLNGPPVDGPCADDRACLSADPPLACTLAPDEIPDRLARWRAIADTAVSRTTTSDGAVCWEFDDPSVLDELGRLAVAEQRCCASFTVTVDARGLGLEVPAPEAASDHVTALFGQPA